MSAPSETAAAEPAPGGGGERGFDLRRQGPRLATAAAIAVTSSWRSMRLPSSKKQRHCGSSRRRSM